MFNQPKIKRAFTCFYLLMLMLSLFILQIAGQSSGGSFTMQKSVVAGGGAESSGGAFLLTGTVGQSAAGSISQNSAFNERSGFWASDIQIPTAAEATISGRVFTEEQDKEGIEGIKITLIDPFTNTVQDTTTNHKGSYIFIGVNVGRFYIITAQHKSYTFIPSQQAITIVEDKADLDFIAVRNVN